jgi:hypothetical protein
MKQMALAAAGFDNGMQISAFARAPGIGSWAAVCLTKLIATCKHGMKISGGAIGDATIIAAPSTNSKKITAWAGALRQAS